MRVQKRKSPTSHLRSMRDIRINTNHNARVLRLNRDVAMKMRLERFLFHDLFNIYNDISHNGALLYAKNGKMIDVSMFKPRIKTALLRHYTRVFNAFPNPISIDIRDELKTKQKPPTNEQIVNERQAYAADRSEQSAQQLSDSTQKRWNHAIETAIALLLLNKPKVVESDQNDAQTVNVSDAQNISQSERRIVADDAASTFDSSSSSRARTAATTETQSAAETNKNIIAVTVLTAANIFSRAQKMWMTILDGRERASHNQANGQKQSINSVYIVQGQQLMYPGDISLGATSDNVINCRCSSIIIVK